MLFMCSFTNAHCYFLVKSFVRPFLFAYNSFIQHLFGLISQLYMTSTFKVQKWSNLNKKYTQIIIFADSLLKEFIFESQQFLGELKVHDFQHFHLG